MLELKIQCAGCGQKYKFDVEPINGRMPWTVQCPVCKTDGTETANLALVPAPIAAAPVHVPKPSAGTIRIGAPTVAPALSEPAAPSAATILEPPPLSMPRPRSLAASPPAPPIGSNFSLGVAGAIAGALLGMIGWYLLIRLTHHTLGYAAIGVGALAGLGGRLLAKQGSHSLGIVAAVCGVIAILLGQFLAIRNLTLAEISKALEGSYDERMVYAKEAVQAKTDDEIKTVLAKANEGDASNATAIDSQAIQKFRQTELPSLQKFVNGSPDKAEYQREQQSRIAEVIGPFVLKESFGLFTILWIFLGVSSAYRVANKN